MQYGLCTNMNATPQDIVGQEQFSAALQAGFDYVELPLTQTMQLSDLGFLALCRKMEEMELECRKFNNFFPVTMRLTGPEANQETNVDYARRSLHRAYNAGADTVVFGSGPAKMVPTGFSMDKGYRQVVDLLKEIGPIAKKMGIQIAIEPLRRAECNLINSFEEGCRLCDAVGHEAVKVLVDFYHLDVEKEPVSNIVSYGKDYLCHVHFAEPEQRRFPQADKAGYYYDFMQALYKINYDGGLSIEGYSDNLKEEASPALQILKNVYETVKNSS